MRRPSNILAAVAFVAAVAACAFAPGSAESSRAAAAVTADFTCAPSCSVTTGTTVTFTAKTDAKTPVYYWDLNGDSPPKFGAPGPAVVSHEYDKPGSYPISLEVVDTASKQQTTVTHTLVVKAGPAPPAKGFPLTVQQPAGPDHAGALWRYTAHATLPAGYRIVAFRWRLDHSPDFEVDTGAAPYLEHRFAVGRHQVQVQGVASNGAVSQPATTITTAIASGAANACVNSEEFGWVVVTAPDCIELHRSATHPSWGVPITGAGISLNGLDVRCLPGEGQCRLDIVATGPVAHPQFGIGNTSFSFQTNHPVELRVPNSINGPLDLGRAQLNLMWATPPLHTEQVPLATVSLPSGQQFAGTNLSGTASIAFTPPNSDADPGVSVTFDMDLTLFGNHTATPVTIVGDPEGDWHTASSGWSVDLSGTFIPLLVYFNHLVLTYQDHLDTAAGYDGPPLNDVFEANGSATILLTGWTIDTDVVVANGFPIAVHFAYDHGSGAGELSPSIDEHFFGLDHLSGDFQSMPYFQIGGEVDVSMASYKVGGGLLYTAPHDGRGFELLLNGQVPFLIPGVDIDLGVDIVGPPTIAFGVSGTFSADFNPLMSAEGGLYFYFVNGSGTTPGNAEFGIHARLTIIGFTAASGAGFINDDWFAGCADLFGFQVYGVGSMHNPGPSATGGLGGCSNIAPFSIAPGLAGLSSFSTVDGAATPMKIKIPAGLGWANFDITSASGTPQVHVVGPGVNFTTPPGGVATAGNAHALASNSARRLLLGLQRPAPGTYTFTLPAGAPAVIKATKSFSIAASVQARVAGRGRSRALHYVIRRIRGQRVTFVEKSSHGSAVIGSVSGGGTGTIRFHPASFAGLRRTIVALPTLDKMPRAAITVAAYTAPRPAVPNRPKRLTLRVNRRNYRVLATWQRVPDAARYELTITARDGRRLTLFSTRARIVIPSVFPGDRVSITVRAQAKYLLVGPPARRTLLVRRPRRVAPR